MVTKLKGFTEVDPFELDINAFKAINKDWMELCVGDASVKEANAMTASWGGMGVMWNMPVAIVMVRGEEYRYSRHLIDEQPMFSLCFLSEDQQKAKSLLGSTHGWDDHDKIGTAGLQTGWCGAEIDHNDDKGTGSHWHTPFIEESDLVLVCEKIASQELPQECFGSAELWEKWYTKEGQHRLYFAEIKAAFKRD